MYHRSFPSRKALLQNKSALLRYEWGHHKYERITVDRYSAKKNNKTTFYVTSGLLDYRCNSILWPEIPTLVDHKPGTPLQSARHREHYSYRHSATVLSYSWACTAGRKFQLPEIATSNPTGTKWAPIGGRFKFEQFEGHKTTNPSEKRQPK